MCGIVGVVGASSPSHLVVEEAVKSLSHRGPDARGTLLRRSVCLGMCRLAIVDPEGGHQPVSNESQAVHAICNGEIYNHVELRSELIARGHEFRSRSDAEVLVHLYEEEGPQFVHRLRGMFAFALWDETGKKLLLARDRFGQKPLYVHHGRKSIFFASELKALRIVAAGECAFEVDPQAIYDYLSLGIVPQAMTPYRDLECLPPGHLLVVGPESSQLQRYWSPSFSLDVKTRGAEEQEQAVRSVLRESVRIHLRSDVPIGIFLSGGIDSSILAYEATRAGLDHPVRTFTVKVADSALDESPLAARTASELGVENTQLRLDVAPERDILFIADHFDQPFADSSAIPTLSISREARKHVKVVLNGDGGDELFLGYRRQMAAALLARSAWLQSLSMLIAPAALLASRVPRRTALGFGARFLRGLPMGDAERWLAWGPDFLNETDKQAMWVGDSCRPTEEWLAEQMEGSDPLTQMISLDIKVNLLSDLLVKMDMSTMAASLEARSPFLDHEVAELALSLPYEARVNGRSTKRILRSAYRGRLPDEVLDGAKRGFEVPVGRWLRGELRNLLHDSLLSADARIRDYLDVGAVRGIVEGRRLRDRNTDQLTYALLMLELWLRHQGESSQERVLRQ
jgi:asparagine synthase (glutamine-hydrolysing)